MISSFQEDILDSLGNAYVEDPSPASGRTYFNGEEEYDAACKLLELGFLHEITSGVHDGTRWVHFGLTDTGLEAAEAFYDRGPR